MNITDLRRGRGEIADRMQALLDAGLTDESRAEFDRLAAEAEVAKADILRAEALADEQRTLDQPATTPLHNRRPSDASPPSSTPRPPVRGTGALIRASTAPLARPLWGVILDTSALVKIVAPWLSAASARA